MLMLFWGGLQAQHRFQLRVLDEGRPLQGVNAYFPKLGLGAISDSTGLITINGVQAGRHRLHLSYLGYETLELTVVVPQDAENGIREVELYPTEEEIDEVVITSTRTSRTIEDLPTRVEVIAGEELAEKGNMKPGDIRMLLNESTGIQTQQTSATSYNSSIRIQGLDGKYTQLLRDGMPLYSGFSGGLSLMQITPLDLKQVEVVKGASSTLYGEGAIAGLVNLISKTPEDGRELSLMWNGTSALGMDASGFYSDNFGRVGTTVFASYNAGTAYDPADIGLTAIPEFDRFTLNPRLFIDLGRETRLMAGASLIAENRLGGNLDFIRGEEIEDAYFEENQTMRFTTQFVLTSKLGTQGEWTLKNSLNRFDRTVNVPDYVFGGAQFSSFSELSWQNLNERNSWIAGLNLWTDRFDQQDGDPGLDLSFSRETVGGFVENTWAISPEWILETGFRLDRTPDFGWFPLPRFSLMHKPGGHWTFRLGGGQGYRLPTSFSEDSERIQFRGLRPLDFDELEAERSLGANFDINTRAVIVGDLSLNANVLFFYTRIDRPLVLQAEGEFFDFSQPGGYIDTQGVEVNLKWGYRDLKWFVGYTLADVQRQLEGTVTDFPLVARHRLNQVLMYEKHDDFWIGLEAYYFSPQLLGDGSTGRAYWITGLMTEKRINEHLSIFLNFENFLDTRQTAFDTVFTGSLSNPSFRDIYAPVDGFVVNGGFKWRL